MKFTPFEASLTYRQRLALRGYSFHLTSEDWCPSFDGPQDREGGGEVAIAILPMRDGTYRVIVTGADDTAMVRDGLSLDEAREVVLRLPFIVDRDYLRVNEFVPH